MLTASPIDHIRIMRNSKKHPIRLMTSIAHLPHCPGHSQPRGSHLSEPCSWKRVRLRQRITLWGRGSSIWARQQIHWNEAN